MPDRAELLRALLTEIAAENVTWESRPKGTSYRIWSSEMQYRLASPAERKLIAELFAREIITSYTTAGKRWSNKGGVELARGRRVADALAEATQTA